MKKFLAILTLFSATSLASVPVQQQLSDVFASADLVLFIEVTSGEVIRQNEMRCGTNYRLRVIRSFKGESTDFIDVTDRGGLVDSIGRKALVFLYKTDGFRPGSYAQYAGLDQFIDSCTSESSEIQVGHVLKQTYHPESVGMNGLIVKEALLAVPPTLQKLCAVPSDGGSYYPALVDQEDFFSYLASLGDGT